MYQLSVTEHGSWPKCGYLHPGAISVCERSQWCSHEVYSHDASYGRLHQRTALLCTKGKADAPNDDRLRLSAVELSHGGDDGSVGAPAVDAVGLEGAGGDGEACERYGERAGKVEAGAGERRVPL